MNFDTIQRATIIKAKSNSFDWYCSRDIISENRNYCNFIFIAGSVFDGNHPLMKTKEHKSFDAESGLLVTLLLPSACVKYDRVLLVNLYLVLSLIFFFGLQLHRNIITLYGVLIGKDKHYHPDKSCDNIPRYNGGR